LYSNWECAQGLFCADQVSSPLPYTYIYSQTCIKRSPLGQRKNGLIRQVTS